MGQFCVGSPSSPRISLRPGTVMAFWPDATYLRCVRSGRCASYATSGNDRPGPEIGCELAELRRDEDLQVLRVVACSATAPPRSDR